MTADLMASHLEFPVSLHGLYKHLDTPAMIDSDATGIYINESMVNEHQLHRHLLKDPLHISNIDSSVNRVLVPVPVSNPANSPRGSLVAPSLYDDD